MNIQTMLLDRFGTQDRRILASQRLCQLRPVSLNLPTSYYLVL